jgi:hypothetical protein
MRGAGEGGFTLCCRHSDSQSATLSGASSQSTGAPLRHLSGIGGIQGLDVELDRFGGVLGLQLFQGSGHHDATGSPT